MLIANVRTAKTHYPIYLGQNIINSLGRLMVSRLPLRPCLIVSDTNVAPLYGRTCQLILQKSGFIPYLEILESGEQVKTTASAEILYLRALEAGLDRRSSIIALGGGVIGDLAGFVASTFLRGINLVQIPTTLLAMLDSSIGGKVAVNHPWGKNIIGAFHHPTMIVSDTAFLETLPLREWKAGMAELIKYAVIGDVKLFVSLENLKIDQLQRPRGKILLRYIARAVQMKSKVVFLDEKEHDYRRVLNFGHTVAHALEAATDYGYYLHGEAVAIGIILETVMAQKLNLIDTISARRIINLVQKLEPPPPPSYLNAAAVQKALKYDKKKEDKDLLFVLPEAIGRVGFYRSVPEKIIYTVINSYMHRELKL